MQKSEEGFSLVELVVVMVLMGIICVAVLPATKIVYRQQAKSMANEICLDLSLMRQKSIDNGQPNTLTLVTDVGAAGYNGYELTNGIPLDGKTDRKENKSGLKQMSIEMTSDSNSTPFNQISFLGNKAKRGATAPLSSDPSDITEVKLSIKSKDQEAKATFNVLTGHYVVTIN